VRVELLTSLVGRAEEHHEGDVIELPDDLAQRLIDRGSAAKAKAVPPAARTAAQGRSRATSRRGEQRG
jgi:hypothetical protein